MCTFVDRPRWAESSWDARGANAAFPLASRPRYFTVTGKSDFSNSEIEYLLSIAHTRTYSPIILPKRWDHHQKPVEKSYLKKKALPWKRVQHITNELRFYLWHTWTRWLDGTSWYFIIHNHNHNHHWLCAISQRWAIVHFSRSRVVENYWAAESRGLLSQLLPHFVCM